MAASLSSPAVPDATADPHPPDRGARRRALLPGDPGPRAAAGPAPDRRAADVQPPPRAVGLHRAWRPTAQPLTIQSHRHGRARARRSWSRSCADLGLEAALRVGTCGALAAGLALGDLVVVDAALSADGTSRALGAGARSPATPRWPTRWPTRAAVAAEDGVARAAGPIVTTDLFYDPDPGRAGGLASQAGALAVEMEAATVLTRRRGAGAARRRACWRSATCSTGARDGSSRTRWPPRAVRLGRGRGGVERSAQARPRAEAPHPRRGVARRVRVAHALRPHRAGGVGRARKGRPRAEGLPTCVRVAHALRVALCRDMRHKVTTGREDSSTASYRRRRRLGLGGGALARGGRGLGRLGQLRELRRHRVELRRERRELGLDRGQSLAVAPVRAPRGARRRGRRRPRCPRGAARRSARAA